MTDPVIRLVKAVVEKLDPPPLCRCHGEPMRRNGRRDWYGREQWCCRVKRHERYREKRAA